MPALDVILRRGLFIIIREKVGVVTMPGEEHIKFLIADDHPLFRGALRQAIEGMFSHCNVVEAEDIDSLHRQMESSPLPSLVLLDLHMPGAHGFSGLIYLNAHFPQVPVIMVSAHDTPEIIHRALDHGAAGFLSKSSQPEVIANAIGSVLAGNIWKPEGYDSRIPGSSQEEQTIAAVMASLTPQQFRVASMLAQGLLNKQIAYELNVTEATVKAHLTEIFRKLGVHSRTQAVLAISHLDVQENNTLEQR